MSHIERLERGSRQGQRRKHQRWSGQDHFHYDSRSHHAVQHYDGLKAQRLSTRLAPSDGGRRGYVEMLDELTLEHMTQDCSLLKNQLLRLKTLLQLEDTDSSPDVPVETEDNSSASQLEELIKEVQVLKAELRTRDKTIAQLTFQLQQQQQQEQTGQQTRCHCHHQRAPSSLQRDKLAQQHHHYDKATQTYWRPPAQGHAPQVLQPSSRCLSELLLRGRPVRTPPTEGRSEEEERGGGGDARRPLQDLRPPDSSAPAHPGEAGRGAALARPASAAHPRTLLQPLGLRKRTALMAPRPAGGAAATAALGPTTEHARQLPPPSRGLPSFSLSRTSLLQPQRTPRSYGGATEPEQGVPPPPARSCLPKPKTP